MYTSILVPLDGSPRAEKILPHATEMARRYGAEIILLKVDEPEVVLGRDEVVDVDRYVEDRERRHAETQAYLAMIKRRLGEEGVGVTVTVAHGSAVRAILETARAWNASIVAMASHGVNALTRQFYGSTVAGVLQQIDRPLLLIRSRSQRESMARPERDR